MILKKIIKVFKKYKYKNLGSVPIIKKLPSGFLFEIDPLSDSDLAFYNNTYEIALILFLKKYLHPGDVCIDIGGHKGFVTINMSKLIGNFGSVYTFEPDPNAHIILNKNLQLNNISNVKLRNMAIGSYEGMITFYLNNYLGHSSSYPNKYAMPNVSNQIEVEINTLDNVIRDNAVSYKRLAFVKIDAEGAEEKIINGFSLLNEILPLVHMELNFNSLEIAGTNIDNFIRSLNESGFDIYDIRAVRKFNLMFKFKLSKIDNLSNFRNKDMIDILIISKKSPFYNRFRDILKLKT
jgi:FkbM family methyltransferase